MNKEGLLLTDSEIRACLKKANDEAQLYGDDGQPLPEKSVAIAQLGKLLKPEWKDKPDSEGWWWFFYTGGDPEKLIVDGCWEITFINKIPKTYYDEEWQDVREWLGKWTKAFVPEVGLETMNAKTKSTT